MIRSSLKEAIQRTLDSHHYLGSRDFVTREYEKDNEACLAVAYRERRVCSFVFQVRKQSGFVQQTSYAITMSPGRKVFEDTLTVNDRSALLQEVKGWLHRVHEDIGPMPRSRLFQAHIRGISRIQARLGLVSNLVVERSADDRLLDELHDWDLALQEFVGASQASHERVLIRLLKCRVKEIDKIREYLAALPADFAGDAFSLHRELDRIKKEAHSEIERSMALKERLDDGKLCLLENDVYLAVIEQFNAHSAKIEEIRKRLGLMPGDAVPSLERAALLFEELQSLHKYFHGSSDLLKSFHNDEVVKKLKSHLAESERIREGDSTLDIQRVLEEMRKDISVLQAADALEREKFRGVVRSAVHSILEKDDHRQATIQFLNERIRTIDNIAGTYLDELISPIYLSDAERALRQSALVRLEQKKRTFTMAIRILKEEAMFRIISNGQG